MNPSVHDVKRKHSSLIPHPSSAHRGIELHLLGLPGHGALKGHNGRCVGAGCIAIANGHLLLSERVTVAKNAVHRALLMMLSAATMFGLMAFSSKIATGRL